MELTNKFIEEHGFTKVNNSMWRKGDVTIQNDWITEGDTVYERLFGYKKAYKICLSGKYLQHITTVTDFKVFVCGLFDDACESKCNKHDVIKSVCPDCGSDLIVDFPQHVKSCQSCGYLWQTVL